MVDVYYQLIVGVRSYATYLELILQADSRQTKTILTYFSYNLEVYKNINKINRYRAVFPSKHFKSLCPRIKNISPKISPI